MARTISTVKIAASDTERINALSQYIRSDLSKATAAIRRKDDSTFELCIEEIRANLDDWVREAKSFIEG